jgi:hypothetical protein
VLLGNCGQVSEAAPAAFRALQRDTEDFPAAEPEGLSPRHPADKWLSELCASGVISAVRLAQLPSLGAAITRHAMPTAGGGATLQPHPVKLSDSSDAHLIGWPVNPLRLAAATQKGPSKPSQSRGGKQAGAAAAPLSVDDIRLGERRNPADIMPDAAYVRRMLTLAKQLSFETCCLASADRPRPMRSATTAAFSSGPIAAASAGGFPDESCTDTPSLGSACIVAVRRDAWADLCRAQALPPTAGDLGVANDASSAAASTERSAGAGKAPTGAATASPRAPPAGVASDLLGAAASDRDGLRAAVVRGFGCVGQPAPSAPCVGGGVCAGMRAPSSAAAFASPLHTAVMFAIESAAAADRAAKLAPPVAMLGAAGTYGAESAEIAQLGDAAAAACSGEATAAAVGPPAKRARLGSEPTDHPDHIRAFAELPASCADSCDSSASRGSVAAVALPPCGAIATAAGRLSAARESSPHAYLCTGCDAFLTHEPGVMDAMALIHSRIARVFYAFPHPGGPQAGALQGAARLHTLPSINHRFRVFRVEAKRS